MKQVRKILALLLTVMLTASLAACGGKPTASGAEAPAGTSQGAVEEVKEAPETGAVKLREVNAEPQELYSSDKMAVSLAYITCEDNAYQVVYRVENKTNQPVDVIICDSAINGVVFSGALVTSVIFKGGELEAGGSRQYGTWVTAEALSLIRDDVLREISEEFSLADPKTGEPIAECGRLTVQTSAYDANAEVQVDGLVFRDRNGVKLMLDRKFLYQRDEEEEPYDVVELMYINDSDYPVRIYASSLELDGVSFEVDGSGITIPPHLTAYYLLTGNNDGERGLGALTDTGSFDVLDCKLSIDAEDAEGNAVFHDWKYLYHSFGEDGTPYAAKTPHESGTPQIDDQEVYNQDGVVVTANYFGTPVHNNHDYVYGELKMTVVNDSDQDIWVEARRLDGQDMMLDTELCGNFGEYESVLVPAHNFEDVYVFIDRDFMANAQLSTFSTMDVAISSDSGENIFTIPFAQG